MRFTFNWLKEYLRTDISCSDICKVLNKIGHEVEICEDVGARYNNIVVGEVREAVPHQDSDKLTICSVFDGHEELQIVCGAKNVKKGIKVPLAKIGAKFDDMTIEQCKLRGVDSYGMICSEDELKISETESEGIMILSDDAQPGTSFAKYYHMEDYLIDINVMPNRRQDCCGVRGIARELAAAGAGEFIELDIEQERGAFGAFKAEPGISVTIEDESCLELSLFRVSLTNKYDAPRKIVGRLNAIGELHELPLVNLSNYVMYDCGRPNHFYDAEKVAGKIRVRKSVDKEKFNALNGVKYLLKAGLTVIADDEKILSLAGVIGGEESKISGLSREMIIEIANFSPKAVIESGRHVMLPTGSRMRFEAGVSQDAYEFAIGAFSRELSTAGALVRGSFIKTSPEKTKEVTFTKDFISRFIGQEFDIEYIEGKLKALGFGFKETGKASETITVEVPQWRSQDISSREDIAEEILRLYGINNIADNGFFVPNPEEAYMHKSEWEKRFKVIDSLLSRGMSEAITWSFYDEEKAKIFGSDIAISNPITNTMTNMRKSMLPQLMDILKSSIARGDDRISLFETGNVYSLDKAKYNYEVNGFCQSMSISGIRHGNVRDNSINEKNRTWDFYDIKEDVLAILDVLGVEKWKAVDSVQTYFHPGRSMSIAFGENYAHFGDLHPKTLKAFGIEGDVMAFEILLHNTSFLNEEVQQKRYKLAKYQGSNRDLSFIVDKSVNAQKILNLGSSVSEDNLRNIKVFDVYDMDERNKAIGITLTIRSEDKNMTEEEINSIVSQVVKAVEDGADARLRSV